jgi:hypothetical protein
MSVNKNVIIICATVAFVFILAFGLAVQDISKNTTTTISLLTLLFTQLGLLIAAIGTLIKTDKTKNLVEENSNQIDKIMNGEMENKILKVLNRVVPPLLAKHVPLLLEQHLAQHPHLENPPSPSPGLAAPPLGTPTDPPGFVPPGAPVAPPSTPPTMGGGQVGG